MYNINIYLLAHKTWEANDIIREKICSVYEDADLRKLRK